MKWKQALQIGRGRWVSRGERIGGKRNQNVLCVDTNFLS